MNCKSCKADCCSRGLNRDAAFCAGWIGGMTNADRIRAMTDEELAQFIDMIHRNGHTGTHPDCTWLDWLREEAKDEPN